MRIRLDGRPTTEETAAVVATLHAVATAAAAQRQRVPERRPGWLEATRREALGHPPINAPSDLRRP